MFQRLVIHVIQRLRQSHCNLYLKTENDADGREIVGDASCVTRFIKSLITIMENGAKAHLRHLSEFFGLLYEFCRMGEEETLFLLKINVIRSVADFYLGHKTQDCVRLDSIFVKKKHFSVENNLLLRRITIRKKKTFHRSMLDLTTMTIHPMKHYRSIRLDQHHWTK